MLTSTPKKAPEPSLAAWRWRSLFRTSVASNPALSHSWRGMTWRARRLSQGVANHHRRLDKYHLTSSFSCRQHYSTLLRKLWGRPIGQQQTTNWPTGKT